MKTRAQRHVIEAIGWSIAHNEIVTTPWTQERQDELEAIRAEEGGGSVDAGEIYEFWGAAGNGWRVHLRRSADQMVARQLGSASRATPAQTTVAPNATPMDLALEQAREYARATAGRFPRRWLRRWA